MSHRVGIVGAGIAGLVCAQRLVSSGVDVTVFDKGATVGGRFGTRYAPPHAFDLGAQYFTVRDRRFEETVAGWMAKGLCARWEGNLVAEDSNGVQYSVAPIDRFVGTPDMRAIALDLASTVRVRSGTRVDRIVRSGKGFGVVGTEAPAGATLRPLAGDAPGVTALGTFDQILICIPANQAEGLLLPIAPGLAAQARSSPLAPCIAVAFSARDTFAGHTPKADGLFIGRPGERHTSALVWCARDSSKPGRAPGERWVLHASAPWSRAHWVDSDDEIVRSLLADFATRCTASPVEHSMALVQRWRYARAPVALDCGSIFDDEGRVGVGGDWAAGGRVEGAFLSGVALAERVLNAHT